MHLHTKFGHSMSFCSQVITFSVYKIKYIDLSDLEMTSMTLESRSMTAIFELVQDFPQMHLHTKFGHSSSFCSQVIVLSVYEMTYN